MSEIIFNTHGDKGINRAVVTTAGCLSITDPALQVAIAAGTGVSTILKYGKNGDVDTGTVPESIIVQGGLIEFPTADRTHQVVSSSVQDIGALISTGIISSNSETSLVDSGATFQADGVLVGDQVLDDTDQDHSIVTAVVSETELTVEPWHHGGSENKSGDTYRVVHPAGTGTAVAHIKSAYKRGDGTPYTEFVIMNGTTNVPTVNTYFRINRAHGHGAGTNGVNVGNIDITADVDNVISVRIGAGDGQTQHCAIYVPKGFVGVITNFSASIYRSGAAKDALAELEMRSNLWGNDSENIEYTMGVSVIGGPSVKDFNPYKTVGSETDVWINVRDVSDDNTQVYASMDVFLIDKTSF